MPLPILGVACAVGVSTIYYNQPLLLEMAHTYHATAAQAGYVAVATQVGYAMGLLGFVPLGDVVERRGLMLKMYAAVAVALLLMAASPTLPWLIVTSVIAGAVASVTHIALPIAPDLASESERGKAIGTVMTGLLLGVLLARTFSGWVSKIDGWRFVFVVAAVINAGFVPLLAKLMPKLPPRQSLSYAAAMRSLWDLVRTQPILRESSLMGALVFASFSCFWTTLAFLLQHRFGLGAGAAGTFGVVGAAGAAIAPLAGRWSDTRGSRCVADLAAHRCPRPRHHRDGCRDAAHAGGQPGAGLRPDAKRTQPPEYRLHDALLRWRRAWLRAGHLCVGALAMERRLRTGVASAAPCGPVPLERRPRHHKGDAAAGRQDTSRSPIGTALAASCPVKL
jgi:MFS family permease